MSSSSIAIASPESGVGYCMRIFGKETQYEFVKLLRTRAFSLSVIGFPVMFYLLFGSSNRHTPFARYLLGGYSCMGVVSACLFGIGMGIALERSQGWLDLKMASPMPRLAYVGAKMMSCAGFSVAIVAVLLALGITVGGAQVTALEAAKLAGVILAGSLPFTAMALVVALLVPANAGPGIINLIYLPMSFASGFWMPVTNLPHWMQRLTPALPTYHLAQLALSIFGFAQPGSMMGPRRRSRSCDLPVQEVTDHRRDLALPIPRLFVTGPGAFSTPTRREDNDQRRMSSADWEHRR